MDIQNLMKDNEFLFENIISLNKRCCALEINILELELELRNLKRKRESTNEIEFDILNIPSPGDNKEYLRMDNDYGEIFYNTFYKELRDNPLVFSKIIFQSEMISILYPTSDGLVNDVKVIECNQKLVKGLNNEILHKIKEYNESENGFCIKIVEYLIDRNNCFKKIKPLEPDLIKKIKEAYGINNQNDNVGELDISNEIKNFNKVLKHAYINLLFKTHTRSLI